MGFHKNFKVTVNLNWRTHLVGSGQLIPRDSSLQLFNGPTTTTQYTNAQLDDYQGRRRQDFRWRPPLTLTVRARFSHRVGELRGTAGFGFWNDPFAMTGGRWFTLPRAVWFFYASPPSNIKLALQTPGCGWKAATIDVWRWPFLLLAPTTPVAMLLMRWPFLYRLLWPVAQRAISVSEALLDVDMTTWHTYQLEWGTDNARFFVDEALLLTCATPPGGPLGLVLWLDNQGMVVTPWALPRHFLLAADQEQWLELEWVKLTT
jgi:hypothetical protein